MITRSRRARLGALLAAVAVAATAVAVTAGAPAGADPKQLDAYIGLGSDTTQDILNALAGHANGRNFTPIQSAPPHQRQVISFDAVPPAGATDNCITPKVRAATMYRPNGSTQGMRALSRAIDGTGYGPTGQCGGRKDVSGLVDFARSSSGPPTGDTGTALTYVPFGRDAVGFAYYRAAGSPVTSLTRAQLTSLFTNGAQTIGGVRILPCGIQLGSGTKSFWDTVAGVTAPQEAAATAECNNLGGVPDGAGRVQESDGEQLKIKGDLAHAAVPGTQVVVGYSAANFIAQSNGVAAKSEPPAGVDMGTVSDNGNGVNLGKPYTGTAHNLLPASAFYSDGTFGRFVYNVFPTTIIDTGFGNADIRSVFRGPTSAICSAAAQSIVNQFGFLSIGASCGSLALKGALRSGTQ
jgi:ABC-type phosphate transport system substrate-binding protein